MSISTNIRAELWLGRPPCNWICFRTIWIRACSISTMLTWRGRRRWQRKYSTEQKLKGEKTDERRSRASWGWETILLKTAPAVGILKIKGRAEKQRDIRSRR